MLKEGVRNRGVVQKRTGDIGNKGVVFPSRIIIKGTDKMHNQCHRSLEIDFYSCGYLSFQQRCHRKLELSSHMSKKDSVRVLRS